jgi:hypothetical protein
MRELDLELSCGLVDEDALHEGDNQALSVRAPMARCRAGIAGAHRASNFSVSKLTR